MKMLLGGKVKVQTLELTNQPATRKEVRARLISPGGEMAVLTDGQVPIRHLSYIEFRSGKPRGNHFHRLRNEWFYLVRGQVTVVVQDTTTGERLQFPMGPGDLAFISPLIAHVLVPTTEGDGIEYAAEPFDPADVIRHPLEVSA